MRANELPIPRHYDPEKAGRIWKVPYAERAAGAEAWAAEHGIRPSGEDAMKVSLVVVDMQNTFCHPDFEMYVGGPSGEGAVEDTRRLCEFLYRNLHRITRVCPTLDTHGPMQIFHPLFWTGPDGEHPGPLATISVEDVETGRWRFNEALAPALGISAGQGRRNVEHYVRTLKATGKFELTVWPYHGILGGVGHALAALLEEAIFFHSAARAARPDFRIKGDHPFTEHYSVLGPEVETDADGNRLAGEQRDFLNTLTESDRVIVAGEAKSHCVAWTVNDLLGKIRERDESLVRKVYLLEDCTSPVVVPGIADFSREADSAFERFRKAGMHVVRSTDPMDEWPEFAGRLPRGPDSS